MNDYRGWVHYDGCVICPLCREWISVEEYVTEMLNAISAHICKKARD